MGWFAKKKHTSNLPLKTPLQSKGNEKGREETKIMLQKSSPVLAYMPTSQIRDICWKDIENMEHWARRLIHEVLSEKYGSNYFAHTDENGNRLIKSEIVKALQKRVDADTKRFPRLVDALFLENIIEILCNDNLYTKHFKVALEHAYPCGKEDVKHHLTVIKDVRNRYTHSNTMSIRDAERAICYCHDFVDSLRKYYQNAGKDRDYNVPTFLKVSDSLGMTHYFSDNSYLSGHDIRLRSGDVYRVEVEIDPTFNSSEYSIEWVFEWELMKKRKLHNQVSADISITNEMVGRYIRVYCYIITNKDWHKHGWYDDSFDYMITTILPPIEDSY